MAAKTFEFFLDDFKFNLSVTSLHHFYLIFHPAVRNNPFLHCLWKDFERCTSIYSSWNNHVNKILCETVFYFNMVQITKCKNLIFTNGIFSSSLLEMQHLSMGHAETSNSNPELDLFIWNTWNDLEILPNCQIALRTIWNTSVFARCEWLYLL